MEAWNRRRVPISSVYIKSLLKLNNLLQMEKFDDEQRTFVDRRSKLSGLSIIKWKLILCTTNCAFYPPIKIDPNLWIIFKCFKKTKSILLIRVLGIITFGIVSCSKEDIAYGSAVGPIGAYLAKNSFEKFNAQIILSQGEFLNRESKLRDFVPGQNSTFKETLVHGVDIK